MWTVAVLMGLLFVVVGWSKMAGASGINWAARLSQWGYPGASRYAIGGIEILAGIALMVVMAGALVTHLIHGEFVRLLSPLILGGLTYGLYSWQPSASQKA
jgi:hypothetical protein